MKYRNYEAEAVEEIDRETIAMMPEAVKHVGQHNAEWLPRIPIDAGFDCPLMVLAAPDFVEFPGYLRSGPVAERLAVLREADRLQDRLLRKLKKHNQEAYKRMMGG